jgi:hypothetical protein
VVLTFLPGGKLGSEQICSNGDVGRCAPPVGRSQKRTLGFDPPHQRDARSKGIPALGSGAIYPVPESSFVVPRFDIPDTWERGYGLDVGWNRTAGIWGRAIRKPKSSRSIRSITGAADEPSIHAAAIRSRGEWIRA